MRLLLAIDSHKNVADSSLSQVCRYLGEQIRRKLNCEMTLVDISSKPFLNTIRYDAVIVATELWRGKIGDNILGVLETSADTNKRVLLVQSYLSSERFLNRLPRIIPTRILEESLTFQLGMNVDSKLLNPLEKVWWALTKQKVETKYSRKFVNQVVSEIASILEV